MFFFVVARYDLTVFVYGFVYISYLICRLVKATGKNALEKIPKRQMIAVSVALLVSAASVAAINASGDKAHLFTCIITGGAPFGCIFIDE